MKRKQALLFVALAFIAGLGLSNFAMSDIATQKVAVVDVQAVVNKSAQVNALKKEQQAKTQELEKWLQTARADVEKQQTKEGKEKLVKKYDTEFAKKQEAIAKDYQKKLQAIDKSISTTIAEEAKTGGYDLVLSKGVVLYGGADITRAIQKAVK